MDLTEGMLRELDARAARLNVRRQAVITTLLRRALDSPENDRLEAAGELASLAQKKTRRVHGHGVDGASVLRLMPGT